MSSMSALASTRRTTSRRRGGAAARRAIVTVDVTRVADSCGYGVPLMSYEGERPHMEAWAEKKLRVGGKAEIEAYVAEKNAESIDVLPAF